ncbi:MAG: hypothetical protein JWM11_2468 [Planctomycetaceae bacterium]|nr:hypothetical protein [Planctomycetaceae bacterium]
MPLVLPRDLVVEAWRAYAAIEQFRGPDDA